MNSSGREGISVPQILDRELDRQFVVTRPNEVAVQAVDPPRRGDIGNGATRGHHALREHLATENALLRRALARPGENTQLARPECLLGLAARVTPLQRRRADLLQIEQAQQGLHRLLGAVVHATTLGVDTSSHAGVQ